MQIIQGEDGFLRRQDASTGSATGRPEIIVSLLHIYILFIYDYIRIFIYMMYVYIYICVHMYIFIYVYTYYIYIYPKLKSGHLVAPSKVLPKKMETS